LSDLRLRTNAVCADGENALLLRNRSVSFSLAPSDQAALFEFAEGQSNRGDGMIVLWFRNDVASQRA